MNIEYLEPETQLRVLKRAKASSPGLTIAGAIISLQEAEVKRGLRIVNNMVSRVLS